MSFTKLMGTSFNKDFPELVKTIKIGDVLQLVRESSNQYDKNAISIQTKNKHLGYLGAHVARELAPGIDNNGDEYICRVENITGGTGNKQNIGVNISLTFVDTTTTDKDIPVAKDNEFDDIDDILNI